MIQEGHPSEGTHALQLVAASALLGAVYVLYLRVEPHPPDVARLVPITWLAGSVLGGVRAAYAFGRQRHRLAAGLALALNVPSAVLAILFLMGALMGG